MLELEIGVLSEFELKIFSKSPYLATKFLSLVLPNSVDKLAGLASADWVSFLSKLKTLALTRSKTGSFLSFLSCCCFDLDLVDRSLDG